VGFHDNEENIDPDIGRWFQMNPPSFAVGVEGLLLLEKARRQMASLGGGNHFIEICGDESGDTWAMLHSGSRGVGNILASRHIKVAQGLMEKYFIGLPNKDLAYLVEGTSEFDAYMADVDWCQKYAWRSREEMMSRVIAIINRTYGFHGMESVHCHHNYINRENHFGANVWVTRKGAVSAKKGELGIIPGSMGAKSYIVEGLGNPDSFTSCSHGAGRRMSRTAAKKLFGDADINSQLKGVECRRDSEIADELPGAYKPIEEVMANQTDLVKPIHELKQILCVKG
jgi:tRNA-splicing ligase RtcB